MRILDYRPPQPRRSLPARLMAVLGDHGRAICCLGFILLGTTPVLPRGGVFTVGVIALACLMFGVGVREDEHPFD